MIAREEEIGLVDFEVRDDKQLKKLSKILP